MTLASTKNNFLRSHGSPDLVHNVRFSHHVPLTMIVEVYDVIKAEEALPTHYDFPVTYTYVDKPVEDDFIPTWFREFKKLDRAIASAKPTIAETEDED